METHLSGTPFLGTQVLRADLSTESKAVLMFRDMTTIDLWWMWRFSSSRPRAEIWSVQPRPRWDLACSSWYRDSRNGWSLRRGNGHQEFQSDKDQTDSPVNETLRYNSLKIGMTVGLIPGWGDFFPTELLRKVISVSLVEPIWHL